jgi:predicted nucleotidyltransferase
MEDIQSEMITLMKQSKLNLDILISRLQLKKEEVLNVYVIGSRLWGTASYNSDWDFIIVHSKWKGKSSVHNGEIDATVYDTEEFVQKLKEHSLLEVLCVWLPRPFVWKEVLDPTKHFDLDLASLRSSVFEETERDWRMAQKYMEKKNVDRGKKTVVHALRLILLSIQIATNGHITNFQEAHNLSW